MYTDTEAAALACISARRITRTLTRRQMAVVFLVDLGLTRSEVAQELGISRQAVWRLLQRAKERMQGRSRC